MPNPKSLSPILRFLSVVVSIIIGLGFRTSTVFHESASDFQSTSVPQGARSTFWPTGVQGPANGRCEIVAPNGAVVASFVSIAGGVDNGWRAQVISQGLGKVPQFTVEVPKNAPLGIDYRISTATYLWPQSSARFAVMARGAGAESSETSIAPSPNATWFTAGKADAVIRNSGETQYLGGEFYGDDGKDQNVEQVAVTNRPAVYLIMVQNEGKEADSFKITASGVGPGWTGNYFAAPVGGRDISREVGSERGWQTPILAAGSHLVLRVEIRRGDATSVAATTLVRISDGRVTLDAVRATVSMQSIARVEVTVDGGKTWKTATPRGITVPPATMVGLRAVKKAPTLPWPNEPFKPEWHTPGRREIETGSQVWMRSGTNAVISRIAQCGNAVETMIHVTPSQ